MARASTPLFTRALKSSWLLLAAWLSLSACAEELSFTNLVAQGESSQARGAALEAFRHFSQAELLATNSPDFCVMARRYCDLMHDTKSSELQKTLAEKALACAFRAVAADNQNATAHLTLAVCYAKNFPYTNNQTKVNWSKVIKTECETGLALDPKQDIGYHLLGRWNFDVANINFIIKGLLSMVYGGLPAASNEEAIKNFKQAIKLAPQRIIHHYELAKVYEATGEAKLAAAELAICGTLKPVDRDDEEAQRDAEKKLAERR
jgi:tetratricopeptide (TPR) repeat protein